MTVGINLNYFENVITALTLIKNDYKNNYGLLAQVNNSLDIINNGTVKINRENDKLTSLKNSRELFINILNIKSTLHFYFQNEYKNMLITDYSDNNVKHSVYNVLCYFVDVFCNEIKKQQENFNNAKIEKKYNKLNSLITNMDNYFGMDNSNYDENQKHNKASKYMAFAIPSVNLILDKIFKIIDNTTL